MTYNSCERIFHELFANNSRIWRIRRIIRVLFRKTLCLPRTSFLYLLTHVKAQWNKRVRVYSYWFSHVSEMDLIFRDMHIENFVIWILSMLSDEIHLYTILFTILPHYWSSMANTSSVSYCRTSKMN